MDGENFGYVDGACLPFEAGKHAGFCGPDVSAPAQRPGDECRVGELVETLVCAVGPVGIVALDYRMSEIGAGP